VLEHSLRLLHPYLPSVTETIWQNLPSLNVDGRALIISRWPEQGGRPDDTADEAFGRIQEVVRAIRNVRSEYNVEPARRIAAQFSAGDHHATLANDLPLLVSLARLDAARIDLAFDLPAPEKAVTLAVGGITTYLPLAGLVDLDAERKRLQKEIDNLVKQIDRGENLLANEGFVAKAPPELIERERAKLDDLRRRHEQLVERLSTL
jgi:valyl-tRNA synthetase